MSPSEMVKARSVRAEVGRLARWLCPAEPHPPPPLPAASAEGSVDGTAASTEHTFDIEIVSPRGKSDAEPVATEA